MNAVALLLTMAVPGVQYSYRTGLDRQPEYVLQIEPEVLPALVSGEQIFSEIPSDVGPFARLCLMILPPDGAPAKHTAAAEEQFRQLLVSSARYATRDRNTMAADLPPAILWPGRGSGMPEPHYGLTTGWQPDASGQQQFLVQLDPVLVGSLSTGDELYVPIDPSAGRLARFVVKVGKEKLPRISPPALVGADPSRPSVVSDLRSVRSGFSVGGGGAGSGTTTGAASGQGARSVHQLAEGVVRGSSNPQAGWSAAWGPSGYPGGESGVARIGDPFAPAVPVGVGDDSTRSSGPPVSVPPSGPTAPETWAPPPAAIAPLNSSGFSGPSAPAIEPGWRGPGVAIGDPRTTTYAEVRTAALPQASAPAAGGGPVATPTAPSSPGHVAAGASANLPGGLPGGPISGAGTPAAPTNGGPAQGTGPEVDRPWGLLLFVTFALFFSIGGNLYLAYTALEYHSRYRSALERLRAAARGN